MPLLSRERQLANSDRLTLQIADFLSRTDRICDRSKCPLKYTAGRKSKRLLGAQKSALVKEYEHFLDRERCQFSQDEVFFNEIFKTKYESYSCFKKLHSNI